MGITVFLTCLLLSLAGLAACVTGLVRRGFTFWAPAIASLAGSALVWGAYVASIGILERTWTVRSTGFWIAMGIGALGVLLLAGGVRGSLGPQRQG
jgi:hypothetical protein